jgi:chloride channel protein, CIC family
VIDRFLTWLQARDWEEGATLMAFGALIGVVSGLGVVAFYRLIDLAHLVLIKWPVSHFPTVGQAIYWPLLTGIGLWAAYFVVVRSKIPPGQNVPDVQLAVAKRDGYVRTRPVLFRTLASAITLGSGGSAGSEGPVAVLGATLGSTIGRRLRFQPRQLKILVGCGAAAGIAAAFNAPFAGAFFALEEVLGSFSSFAFSPVVIASVMGALTVRPFLGGQPIFASALPASTRVSDVLLYPFLGIACGVVSAGYARAYLAATAFNPRLPEPKWLWPLLAGAATGLIVAASRGILAGDGHLAIPASVFGRLAWYALVGLALGKAVATVITLGFGGSGGVFTPTLFIGAALGGGLGVLGRDLLSPDFVNPHAWAFVGMAGMVAGATRAPLTAIFIVFEMTDDYTYVVPLMIVAVIAYATARRLSPHGLYDGWLAMRGEHVAHGVDRSVMDSTHVGEALDRSVPTVDSGASIDTLVAAAAKTRHGVLPVLDDGALIGLVTHHSLREALADRARLDALILASDLAQETDALSPGDSLRDALAAMNARGLDALPVVESTDGQQKFAGLLSRHDVLVAYEQAIARAV